MHPSILSLQQTLERVASEFLPVSSETVRFDRAFGRILVGPLVADRDSPAIHVSAMDGFAMRLRDISSSRLPIAATIQAGEPPLPLPLDATIKILTGAAVPDGAELVIRREDVEEHEDWIRVKDEIRSPQMGENIRYRGENIRHGARVLEDGTCLGPSQIAAITTFGAEYVSVRRKVRLAIINTGDELKQPESLSSPGRYAIRMVQCSNPFSIASTIWSWSVEFECEIVSSRLCRSLPKLLPRPTPSS